MSESQYKEERVYNPVSDPADRRVASSKELEPGKLYCVSFTTANELFDGTKTCRVTIFDRNDIDKQIGQVKYRDYKVMLKDFPLDWMYMEQTHPHTMVTFTFDSEREPKIMSVLDEDLPKLREGFLSQGKKAAFRALGYYKPTIEHHLVDLSNVIDIKYNEYCLKEA